MKAIKNARIVLPDSVKAGCVLYDEREIIAIADCVPENVETIDARGRYVLPGLIDTHVHGCMGADACDSGQEPLNVISRELIRHGVTRFLATTLSQSDECLAEVFKNVRGAIGNEPGAAILGIHLEGPFINPAKAGAQNTNFITPPREELIDQGEGLIKIITLAPEVDKRNFISNMVKRGITISMGHTNATYEQALAGIRNGVTRVSHCFNAMRSLYHTEPGSVGAALLCPVDVELIADGLHVHPDICKLLYMIKKADKITLVSDSIRMEGMPYGHYVHGGVEVHYTKDGARTIDNKLAGSTLTLDIAVKNMMKFCGIPIWEAVRMATYNPAHAIGLGARLGSIRQGCVPDFVIAGDDMHVETVIRDGVVKYDSKASA